MALYIDDLGSKKIHILYTRSDGSVMLDIKTDATFKFELSSQSTGRPELILIDRFRPGVERCSEYLDYVYINQHPANHYDADALIQELSFIGSFNAGGSVSGSSTLTAFEPGKEYKAGQPVVENGVIYTAKADFEGGAQFSPDDWDKLITGIENLGAGIGIYLDSVGNALWINIDTNDEGLKNFIRETAGAGSGMVPDYAKMESTNRIPQSGGSWTADATGYIWVQAVISDGGNNVIVTIDNKVVLRGSNNTVASGVFQIQEGDVIKVLSESGEGTLSYCNVLFIPPKQVGAIADLAGKVNILTPFTFEDETGEHPGVVEVNTTENGFRARAQDTDKRFYNEHIISYYEILMRCRQHDAFWNLLQETALGMVKMQGDDKYTWHYDKGGSSGAIFTPDNELATVGDIAALKDSIREIVREEIQDLLDNIEFVPEEI
ncbi:MAG: hypothetical protein LBC47_06010 [Tannerella sp.]|nr:hypothetical protein [Tannerella sp.]